MMSSMYSGVSGLRTHQKKMDVIGNNIANVNTLGYKKGQVTFKEVFSQTIQGGGAPQGGKGGTNPQQVGLGGQLGSVNTIHTQGAVQRTDNPTDLMIDGEGYFIVSDDESFNNRYYTRAGNFALDKEGFIVTPEGLKVLGYDENGNLTQLKINKTETVAPVASSEIGVLGNLDSRTADNEKYNTDTTVKDSLGNEYKVNFTFEKNAENDWRLDVDSIESLKGTSTIDQNALPKNIGVTFDDNGKISSADSFDIPIAGLTGSFFGVDDTDNTITVDLSQITQYANENDAKGFDGGIDGGNEGASSGILSGFSIDTAGSITGTFTNGMNKGLGQIALAKFDNNSGLEKMGNNLFKVSPNSGEPQLSTAGSSGLGAIKSGSLEMSNVDLSMEFTEMITTQRGFQANSRIITTSDEMLQELVNLKR